MRIGCSQAAIVAALGLARSTVSRELRRNATRHDGRYRAEKAQQYTVARRRRERRKSWFSPEQWAQVEALLQRKWSPEQVVAPLKEQGLLNISHETIYRHVLKDKKAGGHWEGDTVMGRDQLACILTLVERRSGYAIIKKLVSRTAIQANLAVARALAEHRGRMETLTFDNGTEFHSYKKLEAEFPVTCYFATPYHSWERGSNENLNGLIRQYLPKGTCMQHLTQQDCDRIAFELNTRPRKRHGFKTPMAVYHGS